MPWTTKDVESKTKAADTAKKKEIWVKVANAALKRCEEKGQGDCEARAIKQANAVIGKMGEARGEGQGVGGEKQGDAGTDTCVCPKCGAEAKHERGTPCNETKCPKCGEAMQGKAEESFDAWFDGLDDDGQAWILAHVYGLKSALQSERELRKEAERKMREPQDFSGDVIPLMEKAVGRDGTMPVKIIGPGWGTSGYYSPDILQRDGPQIFTAGTKMFWDHPTDEEEAARPEGSLRDLAAELAEDAQWQSDNVFGPGLYAKAKVFTPFQDAVKELAPHIGVSIRGLGKAKEGEADGRKGPIIEEISAAKSVDFVTMPGAGGKILQLFEAARGGAAPDDSGGDDMEELKKLQEAHAELEGKYTAAETEIARLKEIEAENARLKEIALLGKAKTLVGGKLKEFELPDVTRARLVEALSANPPIVDGELDEASLDELVAETVEAEMAYIAEVAGSGNIRGMGAAGDTGGAEKGREELKESYKAKYISEGKSPEEAEIMAEIAAAGR